MGRRIRIAPAFVDQVDDAVVPLAERLGGDGALSWVVPYLDPYELCLMRLMRLLDVLAVRG